MISSSQRPLHTQHTNKQKGQTSIPSAGFEPAIQTSKRLQSYVLDRTATVSGGKGLFLVFLRLISHPVTREQLMLSHYVMYPTFILVFSAIGCKTKRCDFSDCEVVATVVSRGAGSWCMSVTPKNMELWFDFFFKIPSLKTLEICFRLFDGEN
jgi:hypothetical protein